MLIVGLGNPGPKYTTTRHNIGFLVVDRLASRWFIDMGRTKFKAQVGTGQGEGRQVVLLKPQTYMNLSGQSVSRAAQFWNIPPGGMVVIHDDIDLAFGTLRIKRGGGTGGHNGLKSTDRELGDKAYFRVRFGVGRPEHGSASDHVLKPFTELEMAELDDLIERSVGAVCALMSHGLREAQNIYHAPRGG
ncbi:MAG: aminoacyl-tRNA hydrolase [Myxococcota bacterium]